MPNAAPDDLVPELELAEMRGLADLHRAAPDDLVRELGMEVVEVGTTLALITSRIDVLALNRIVGLGVFEPVRLAHLEDLLERFRRAGVPRAFVQVAPSPFTESLVDALLTRGLTRYNNWLRLTRAVRPLPEAPTDLHIECVGAAHGDAFGAIAAEAFGWSAAAVPWLSASVGRPGWLQYVAFDGATPVATAALHVAGKTGWMTLAATRADARRRGAQSALIARRIADAARLGCVRLSVETAEPTPQRQAPSLRNVIRLGFELAYPRQNYLWQA